MREKEKKSRDKISKRIRSSKKKNLHKDSSIFTLIKTVLLCGIILISTSLLYHSHFLNRLSFSNNIAPAVVATYSRESIPTNIKINNASIDLPIYETLITNNTWEIAEGGISHLAISGRPGEDNTVILYGHNTRERFGPLLWLKIGDEVEVGNLENKILKYTVVDIKEVDSDQVEILSSQENETLIMYTCTGFADLKRHIVIAKPSALSSLNN